MDSLPANNQTPPTHEEQKPARRFTSRSEMFLYAMLRIRQTRRYWLIPVLLLLALLGLFLNLFTGYNVLPAIYSLIP